MKKSRVSVVCLLLVFSILMLSACTQKTDEKVQSVAPQKTEDSKTYTMKLGHVHVVEHPNAQGALKFAELVKAKTNGQVIVEVYPASQLGGEKEITDGISMGTIEFGVIGLADVAKRYKPALIFDGPYIFKDRDHLFRVLKSSFFAEFNEEMAEQSGVRVIGAGYYGTRHVTTEKVAAKTPEEFKGVKLRCPDQPMYVSVTKALGATPTPMAFSEVYLALQQGVVDGQENPVASISTMKFYEVQKYLIKTGHIIQGNHILISEKVLKSLPKELQDAILEAGKEAAEYAAKLAFEAEDKCLDELKAKGLTVIEPDYQAFVRAAESVHKEYEDIWGKGLLEKIRSIE